MSKQTVSLEIEIPEGFEASGEVRRPEVGEWILLDPPEAYRVKGYYGARSVILRAKPRVPKVGEVWTQGRNNFLIAQLAQDCRLVAVEVDSTPTSYYVWGAEPWSRGRTSPLGESASFAFPSLREWALDQARKSEGGDR